MRLLINEHRTALLLTLLVAVVFGAHHIYIWTYLSSQGIGYHPAEINQDEAIYNVPKAQAVLLGKWIVSDFNVYEYKDRLPYIFPFLSALILGKLGWFLGSIERAVIAADFIFPALTFLIFYFIVFEISKNKLFSAAGSAFFIFLPRLAAYTPPIIKYLQAYIITFTFKERMLYFSRLEDPQLTVPLFGLLLYFTIRSLTRNDKLSPWLAALFYGLTFYSYFYYWAYFSAALVFLLLFLLLQKDFEKLKRILRILIAGLVISIPHWINMFALTRLPQFSELLARQGPETGKIFNPEMLPVFGYGLHGALIAALFFFFRKYQPRLSVFFIALLLPIYGVYNIQLVTGFNIQPAHWFKPTMPILYLVELALIYWFFVTRPRLFSAKYIISASVVVAAVLTVKAIFTEVTIVKLASASAASIIALAALAVFLNEKYKPDYPNLCWKSIGVIILALLFIKGAYTQYTFVGRHKDIVIPAEEFASYKWLSENTPKYSVIGTPSFTTSNRLSTYTGNMPFVPNGYNTIASNNEVWGRFFIANKIFKVPPDTFLKYLTTDSDWQEHPKPSDGINPSYNEDFDFSATLYLFVKAYDDLTPGGDFKSEQSRFFPKEIVDKKLSEYNSYLNSRALDIPYRLDYIYFGPRERILGVNPLVASDIPLEKIYDRSGIVIYKIVNQ